MELCYIPRTVSETITSLKDVMFTYINKIIFFLHE